VAGDMTGREWSYVAATRSREETRFYTSEDKVPQADKIAETDLARGMARSQEKDLASDYQEREAPATADKAPAPEQERGTQELDGQGKDFHKADHEEREELATADKAPAPVQDRGTPEHEELATADKAPVAEHERGAQELHGAGKSAEADQGRGTPEREELDGANKASAPDQEREALATTDKAPAPEKERGTQEMEGNGQDADRTPAPDREGQDGAGKSAEADQERASPDDWWDRDFAREHKQPERDGPGMER
jgi:hypothetical protein